MGKKFPLPIDFLILLAGIILRVLVISHVQKDIHCHSTPDSFRFLEEAQTILQQGTLPEYFDMPLYPLFLALLILAGCHKFSILLVSSILSYLCFFVLMRKSGGTQGALLATFFPPHIIFSGLLLSEIIGATLFFLSFYFLWQNNKSTFREFIAGVFASFSLLCRIFTAFPLFIVMIVFIAKNRKFPFIYAGLLAITIAGWGFYNMNRHGRFYLSLTPYFNIYYYHAASVISSATGENFFRVQDSLWKAALNSYEKYTNYCDFYRDLATEGIKIILIHPLAFINNIIKYGIPAIFKPVYGYPQIILFCRYENLNPIENSIKWLLIVLQLIFNTYLWFRIIKYTGKWEKYLISLTSIYLGIVCGGQQINDVRFRFPLESIWIPLTLIPSKKHSISPKFKGK